MKAITIILTTMTILFSTTAEARHHHFYHRLANHHRNVAAQELSNTPTVVTKMVGKNLVSEIVQSDVGYNISENRHVLPTTSGDWSGSRNPASIALNYVGSTATSARNILMGLFKSASQPAADPTKLPWCAAFVNGVLAQSGKTGSGSLMAASFKSWGKPTSNPKVGDVAVVGSHHVGFFLGMENGMVKLVSGNTQHHTVGIGYYSPREISTYREDNNNHLIQSFAKILKHSEINVTKLSSTTEL